MTTLNPGTYIFVEQSVMAAVEGRGDDLTSMLSSWIESHGEAGPESAMRELCLASIHMLVVLAQAEMPDGTPSDPGPTLRGVVDAIVGHAMDDS